MGGAESTEVVNGLSYFKNSLLSAVIVNCNKELETEPLAVSGLMASMSSFVGVLGCTISL